MDVYAKYDCDKAYLESAVENKKRVIAFENQCVAEVNTLLDSFEQELVAMINSFVQQRGKNDFNLRDKQRREAFIKYMKAITSKMQEALMAKEAEATIQVYELASRDQFDLIRTYLELLSENSVNGVMVQFGGEQTTNGDNGLTKPKVTVDKAKSLVTSRRVKKTIDERISLAISDFEDEFMQVFDASTNLKSPTSSVDVIAKMRKSLERKVRKQAEFSMRSGIQTTEEQAYEDIWNANEWVKPTEFQRVEVLDGHVCLECMFVDTTYNEKPLGLLHYNCRGIDIPVYYDKKGNRIHVDGVKYSRRRLSFDERFDRLPKKEQQRMLGKGKFALYQDGKLKPSEFISFGSSMTLSEAERHVALKSIRRYIKTPDIATRINGLLEAGLPPVTRMNEEQLRQYENILGEQKKVLSFVPKKNFPKDHTYFDYVSELEEKLKLVRLRYTSLKGGE